MPRVDRFSRLLLAVTALVGVLGASSLASAQFVGNAQCPGEEVFFNPSSGEDVLVPPGYKIEVFATGLNFPTNIAFRKKGNTFEVFVTEAGTSLPGRCNDAVTFPADGVANPFLPDVAVLDSSGAVVRRLGRPPSKAVREDERFLHAPTIGIAFQHDFGGGRLFATDSRQGVRGAQGPKNSSRIVELNPDSSTAAVQTLIRMLPTGDHPTEQITVKGNELFWSQGSVTNSGVVGHDNTGPAGVGGPPDVAGVFQHEIPCQRIVLSGNNFDSGDGHITGGFLNHGVSGVAGQVIEAFDGAFQAGMCTGAILSAKLSDLRPLAMAPGPNFVQPAGTVRPVSWGYRNPFGIRFAPDGNPLDGALFVSENGEDERGARPTNNAPDRLQLVAKEIVKHGLDYHGWPDRFGFLDSTQAIFNPIGGPADDCASCAAGRPVRPLLRFPPQPPVAPLGIEPTDVAAVGLDFVPKRFAGAGNPGDIVQKGDVLVTREGDFGFSPGNGTPIIGHDIERVSFPTDGTISLERFVFNCKKELQKDVDGRKRCELPPGNATGSNQAFVDHLRGINRPVDGKFGPDGAFYLVDFGAVRDFGRSTNGPPVSVESSMFRNPADQPLVQIPATGVIWKISRIGGERGRDKDDKD